MTAPENTSANVTQGSGIEELPADAPIIHHRARAPSVPDADVLRPLERSRFVDKLKSVFSFGVGRLKRRRTKKERIPKKPTPKTPLDESYKEAKSKYGGGWAMPSHLAR